MTPLEQRTAFVTGGAAGIGLAIAKTLATRGANVYIADIDEGAVENAVASVPGSTGVHVDVTDRSSLEAARHRVYADRGRLDILVANAGVSSMHRFLELTEGEWDRNFVVNAKGTFLTLQCFAKAMVEQPIPEGDELRGKMIATASMAARCAAPLLAHYSASKFAVIGLVQAAAKELAGHKLTLNGVNPGFVSTGMQARELAWEAQLRGMTPDAVRNEYIDMTPLGRIEAPEDVAKAVAFLAGPDSDFLTGEILEVNGGAHMT